MEDFSYYYGSDAEQFNFFRLPKLLVRDKRFDGLSSEAKILYGVLLDRMALSAQNGWLDDDNRLYIIYTTREVMREFGCSERKAITLMGELDTRRGIGLIEKKRQGLGKPNIIYVKNFNSVIQTDGACGPDGRDGTGGGTSGETGARGGGRMGSGSDLGCDTFRENRVAGDGPGQERRGFEDVPGQGRRDAWDDGDVAIREPDACRVIPGLPDAGVVAMEGMDVERGLPDPSWPDVALREGLPEGTVKKEGEKREGEPCGFQTCKNVHVQTCRNVQVKTCKNVQAKTCKNVQVQTCKNVQVSNETDNNETDIKYNISINPSSPFNHDMSGDGGMDRSSVLEGFKGKLGYDTMVCDSPGDKHLIDDLFQILADAYCHGGRSQRVGGGDVPTADVRERLSLLTAGHVRYVLAALKDNTTKVRNIRTYVLTSLYNAPVTMGLYYHNAVAHDMAAGAWKGGGAT